MNFLDFEEYLKTKTTNKGSINSYLSAFRNVISNFNLNINDNLISIEGNINKLYNNDEFISLDKRQHGKLHIVLNHYINYLKNKNSKVQKFSEINQDQEQEVQKFSDRNPVQNPFKDSLCVLGESGAGKSYRVEKTLENEGHESMIVIPSTVSSSILYDYSTISKSYELSELGDFIQDATQNPTKYYTVVFDEFHKYISTINNELLQAISTKRNDSVRFISLPKTIKSLYNFLKTDSRKRLLIPDNLGFIFITSKSDIARGNDDFKNRVQFVNITKEDKDQKFLIQVLKDKIETEDKYSF